MIEFILVKLPVILWAVITVLCIFIDFSGGLAAGVLIGVPVWIWVLIMKFALKQKITYYFHVTKEQKKKLKK